MTTKFNQQGNIFTVHDSRSMVVMDSLPARVYTARMDPKIGFYLEETENFELPSKMYGTVERDAERVLRTFASRSQSTGLLLVGERGSGKTMLAKKISIDGQALGIPTILVSSPFVGDGFNSFMQAITQDCVVLFDEFEKVYDEEDQQKMLTLLDGTIRTKKLFIFTSNEKYGVNAHMQNRPGRIFYMKEYDGISISFIEEYCKDVLKPELQKYIEIICQFSSMFFAFNFDMLKAICEEMNRYDESPQEAVALLNAKPGFGKRNIEYSVDVYDANGSPVFNNYPWSGTPLADPDSSWSFRSITDRDRSKYASNHNEFIGNSGGSVTKEMIIEKGLEVVNVEFDVDDIKRVARDGAIHLANEEGYTMVLTKRPPKKWEGTHVMGSTEDAF